MTAVPSSFAKSVLILPVGNQISKDLVNNAVENCLLSRLETMFHVNARGCVFDASAFVENFVMK